MEAEVKKDSHLIQSSAFKKNQSQIDRVISDLSKSEQKNSVFKKDFSEITNDKNSKQIINGQILDDINKSPISNYNIFNSNISKKTEIKDENTYESNISREKKIYLYLKKNFQNPITSTKINYSPRISFNKREEILGERSDTDSNCYSISIDATLHQVLRKENFAKNKNRIYKENLDISPIKLTNKIFFYKEKHDYVDKIIKASNSFAFKEENCNLNKEINKFIEPKLQTKKSPTNKNGKKKKSLKEYISKKNKKIASNEDQKIQYYHHNIKEKRKYLKNKENLIILKTVSNQQNTFINEIKEKDINKKDLNINRIIKAKNSENKITSNNQIRKPINHKEKNKIDKNEKNSKKNKNKNNDVSKKNKMINNNEKVKNIKNEQKIINDQDEKINKDKEKIINKDINKKIKIHEPIKNIIAENTENKNIIKNIIIKRDLSNKNNNSIFISKNNFKINSNSSKNIIQNDKNNNTIYISKYCINNKNTNNNTCIHYRKNSEDLVNTKINLKYDFNNNKIIHNNSSKNNNLINELYKRDTKEKNENNKYPNNYEDEKYKNQRIIININNEYNNQKEPKVINGKEANKIVNINLNKSNNIDRNINNHKLSKNHNNKIINDKRNPKKEILNDEQKIIDIKNYTNIKSRNKDFSKIIGNVNNKSNNMQYKINKNNKFSRSFLNNKEKDNFINLKNLNRNNSSSIIFNKNISNKNIIINDNSKNNNSIHSYNKNNLAKFSGNNKKPNKIIIQNVVIENNAINNNIFFSNNAVSPHNFLINSFQAPFGQEMNENKNFINDIYIQQFPKKTEINRNIIYPVSESSPINYNINNLNSYKKESDLNVRTINDKKKTIQIMNNTIEPSRNIIKSPYILKHSNSDFIQNSAEKLIASDKKSSSKLISINSFILEQRMNALKDRSKSLLSGHQKAKCSICTKLVETHLLQIHINAHPSQVFNWLFLGTFSNACDKEELRRIKIKYILNCAIECKNKNIPKDIKELHLKIRDNVNFDIFPFFQQANDFINKARLEGGAILIHCKLGISRSAAIILAYLMKYYGFSLNNAIQFIKKQRDRINPNQGFMEQLKKYENMVQNKKI